MATLSSEQPQGGDDGATPGTVWLGALDQLQNQAQAQGDADLAALCGLLREVVEGRPPGELAARVPAALQDVWERLERGLVAGD